MSNGTSDDVAMRYAVSRKPICTLPRLNGVLCSLVIDGSDIVYRDYVDISCAVATPKVSIACI